MISDPATLKMVQALGPQQLTMFGESEVAAELYCDEGLDGKAFSEYVDRVGSVSASEAEAETVFDDQLLENQYRRFHNGG